MADHNTLLNSLTDEELLRHFHAQHDPLTSTPITDELAKRFEALLDLHDANERVLAAFDDLHVDIHTTDGVETVTKAVGIFAEFHNPRPVLEALSEAGIHTVDEVKTTLQVVDQFNGIAKYAGDIIARLSTLITNAQE
jgi:hypothetical protein